jgi:ATP-dependent RNA helicase RhlE
MGFTKFGLSDQLMKGISAAGYTVPTPIQSLAIQPILEGKDMIGRAQTGTGKTAAFVLPLLQRLTAGSAVHGTNGSARMLVLTPTRELAQQVQTAVATYGRFLPLRSVSIYGGVSMDNQLKLLRRGTDIVVATPGRLLDHMQRGSISLSKIQVLVLDEADRMLDMGFINDVRKIIKQIPAERQTLLFSATISSEIKELASRVMRDPHTVEAGEKRDTVATIVQHFYHASQATKTDLLLHAIEAERMESVLVFSRTKHGADKICKRLERKGIASVAIHSNRTQSQRERALEGFKRGQFRVLVATDIAARGIDVTGISHVINFDIPRYAEDYIHRIGRTGRAGAAGDAITFLSRDEQQYLKRIESFVGRKFPVKEYQGFTAPERSAISNVAPRTENRPQRQVRHGRPERPGQDRHKQHSQRKKQSAVGDARKKRPAKRMDTFSSDHSGSGWSNY